MKTPALLFGQGLVNGILNEEELYSCTYLGYKSGFYDDALVIDADCKEYKIKKAILQPLTRWQRLIMFTGPLLKVSFELYPEVKQLSFEEVKKRSMKTRAMQKECPVPELRPALRRAKSMSELAKLLH